MPLSTKQREALEGAARAAVSCQKSLNVPAEVMVAQWAIESGWGKHSPGNNCFGIKLYPGAPRQLLKTREWFTDAELVKFLKLNDGRAAELAKPIQENANGRKLYIVWDWFARFPDLAACFRKRALLFSVGRYERHLKAWQQDGDVEKLVKGIGPIYATDPRYAESVLRVIRMPEVTAALAKARAS